MTDLSMMSSHCYLSIRNILPSSQFSIQNSRWTDASECSSLRGELRSFSPRDLPENLVGDLRNCVRIAGRHCSHWERMNKPRVFVSNREHATGQCDALCMFMGTNPNRAAPAAIVVREFRYRERIRNTRRKRPVSLFSRIGSLEDL